jgi:uncharacterized membrane protein YoaK (UPF0700 family)
MDASKDYTHMSLEELVGEEKKARREQITVSVLIGFMVGVLVFALVSAIIAKSFSTVAVLLPAALVYVFYRLAVKSTQRLAGIRAELGRKRGQ